MKGKFIVIEGGDGAGKDTQVDLLRTRFQDENVLFVRDPGSTEMGEMLRQEVLHNKRIVREAELFLYLASRAQLVHEKILPALESGQNVICHRFDLSTIAYQVYGRQRQELQEFVKGMSDFALGGTQPDLVVYLDCPPEVGLKRVAESGQTIDRFESEKLAFHERVREGYLANIGQYEHVTIDATRPVDQVYDEVEKAVLNAMSLTGA